MKYMVWVRPDHEKKKKALGITEQSVLLSVYGTIYCLLFSTITAL